MSGLPNPIDWDELFGLHRDFWLEDVAETKNYLDDQLGDELPEAIRTELNAIECQIKLNS